MSSFGAVSEERVRGDIAALLDGMLSGSGDADAPPRP